MLCHGKSRGVVAYASQMLTNSTPEISPSFTDVDMGASAAEYTVHKIFHPFNTHIKRYLLQNFRILSTDQQTRDIFPQPPVVAYKRDLGLRGILVHSTDSSSTEQPGSHACRRPRCHTCEFITPLTEIQGPKSTFTIRDHFTSMSHEAKKNLLTSVGIEPTTSGLDLPSLCRLSYKIAQCYLNRFPVSLY